MVPRGSSGWERSIFLTLSIWGPGVVLGGGTQSWEAAGDRTVHGNIHEPRVQAPDRRSIVQSDFSHKAQTIANFKTVTAGHQTSGEGLF